MLSPCSILSNNISVVASLRKMLEKQVEIKEQEEENRSTVKERLFDLKDQAIDIKIKLKELKDIISKNTFQNLVPQQFKRFLKQETKTKTFNDKFDDKQNRQSNNDIRNYNSKSVNHSNSYNSNYSKQNHTLRSRIFRDLAELRRMQQKDQCIRNPSHQRNNSRNLNICTQYKRKPLQQLQINQTRSVNHNNSRDQTFVTQESLQSRITQSIIKPIEQSNITVPALNRYDTKCLFCSNKHEYYSGDILEGRPHGKGRLFICCDKTPIQTIEGSQFYTGGFKYGKPEGYGTLTFKNGTKFVGTFKNGLRHGDGSIYYKGSVEMGKWVNGKLSNKI